MIAAAVGRCGVTSWAMGAPAAVMQVCESWPRSEQRLLLEAYAWSKSISAGLGLGANMPD